MSVINHNDPVWQNLMNSIQNGDKNNILKIVDQVGINRLFSGSNHSQTIMSMVIQRGSCFEKYSRVEYVNFIRMLLNKGACPHLSGDVPHNSQTPAHLRDPHTQIFSALYWAVYNKYYDILLLFVEFKVDFRRNDSILQYLILYPTEIDYEIFKLLVLNGANINCKVYSGKVYSSLLEFYNSYYPRCNENEVARKIKKILESGIQHVIELEKLKQQEQKEREIKKSEEVELQQKKIEYENFLSSELHKICDNIKTFETQHSEFSNIIQDLVNKNEIIMSTIQKSSIGISNTTKLLNEFHIYKSETDRIEEVNKDDLKIKLDEIEKMTFEQKTSYFDELEKKITVDKQKIQEQKIWISTSLKEINAQLEYIQSDNEYEKYKQYEDDRTNELQSEYTKINNIILNLENNTNIPDTIKQNIKSTNYVINQYYNLVEKFKNDTKLTDIQYKLNSLRQIEHTNKNKNDELVKQKNVFVRESSAILPDFHNVLQKIEKLNIQLESKLDEVKKTRLYDKTEAGTYIKLALDQIQSISTYNDAIPSELKDFYGKTIAHLLIQAKQKMPPSILNELIPKLPENFHPYLTLNDTDSFIPPWKN